MRILLIGGTRFLGRHVVARALEIGHEVTLFHRGRTHPELFPACERVIGDREKDLTLLDGRTWDAVVDTCGFAPRVVGETVRQLAGRIGHYTFISSISVYADPVPSGADESAPLATLADDAGEVVTGASYGGLKALCERAAEAELPWRVLSVRAGLLAGPWDYTDRFGYWVRRYGEGGEMLVPDAGPQPLQLIDARDAAQWIVEMAEAGVNGVFNVTGPSEPLTLGACLDRMGAAVGSTARRVPVGAEFLAAREVQPWSELPLWVPEVTGFLSVNIARAIERGLRFRPLEDTVRDTWDWLLRQGGVPATASALATPPPASLSRERERELLEAWARR